MMAACDKTRLSQAEISQPCCTALQVALIDLLYLYNIKPAAVIGHSSGEIAAAYAAGALTAREAISIAYYRGRVVNDVKSTISGAMAAIGLGADVVRQHLCDEVVIGCENSPESATISGDRVAVHAVMEAIQKCHPEALVRLLHVDRAYHSRG